MNTKTIAWITGALTLLLALFSFILSFNALADLAAQHNVSIPYLFPLVVEAGVIIFSLNALYRSIHDEHARWQWVLIIGSSLLAGTFNVLHAEPDPVSRIIAAMPSLFLLLSFESFLNQVKHGVKRSNLVQSLEQLNAELMQMKNNAGKPVFEISTWRELSPFTSIARIVDLLIIVVRVILISIVLISILNVMMMSVYERVSEIGTIASIGTPPGRILSLFLVEGFALGLMSSIVGGVVGMGLLLILRVVKLNFTFGRMDISLSPSVPLLDVVVTILIVIVISVISTLQPAIRASRLEPVEALRHV